MTETEFIFIYSTFPDEVAARNMAETLVRERLAACVNIHAQMTSIYKWEGLIEAEPEVAVFIKTRAALADEAIAAARALHPYSVPCFLIVPITGGNDDYLAWLRAQTKAG